MHNEFLRAASDIPIHAIGKIILFFQLADLKMGGHSGDLNDLAMHILVRTSSIDKFVKEIFLLGRWIALVPFRPVVIILKYMPWRIRWLW